MVAKTVLIYISLIRTELKCLFIWLRAFCISLNYLFMSFAHFSGGLLSEKSSQDISEKVTAIPKILHGIT